MDQLAWLDQVTEEIVEPEREICDPHHPLWDHSRSRYLLDELLAPPAGCGHYEGSVPGFGCQYAVVAGETGSGSGYEGCQLSQKLQA